MMVPDSLEGNCPFRLEVAVWRKTFPVEVVFQDRAHYLGAFRLFLQKLQQNKVHRFFTHLPQLKVVLGAFHDLQVLGS